MRWSQTFIPTLKEDPTDAEVISHKLLVRAGMIRQVSRGIYDYLPLALKIIRKIENIVREEMDRAGAQELLLPIASPAELWQQSGRWEIYGKELVRFKDRHERDFCLDPAHEEGFGGRVDLQQPEASDAEAQDVVATVGVTGDRAHHRGTSHLVQVRHLRPVKRCRGSG